MKKLCLLSLFYQLLFLVQAQKVNSISEMRKVMMGEELSAHLLWDTIPHQNLFSISPLGRIEGEITIVDGQIFVAKVDKKGNIVITNNGQKKAPFGVYAHIKAWQSFDFGVNINTDDAHKNMGHIEGVKISQKVSLGLPAKE